MNARPHSPHSEVPGVRNPVSVALLTSIRHAGSVIAIFRPTATVAWEYPAGGLTMRGDERRQVETEWIYDPEDEGTYPGV